MERLKRRRRKRSRKGEVVCLCRAYTFPHRMTGGRCTGHGWVQEFFEPHRRDCRRCSFNEGFQCQVAEGLDLAWECPAFQDMAASAEMKRPALNRGDKRFRVRTS